jgi:hypothetical protein
VYPKVPGLSCNEISNNNNNNKNSKHSPKSNKMGYGGKTHYTDSQNSDKTASSGRELYHLQFLLQAASQETFGYNLEQKHEIQPVTCNVLTFHTKSQ